MVDDQNRDFKTSVEKLDKCQQEREEYLNNWKRERADFLNYKKDEAKRMEEFLKFSTEGIITELIDVIDGIEVARNNLPTIAETQNEEGNAEKEKKMKEWAVGFDGSLDKIGNFLKKFGVEKIQVQGKKFNPLFHEAVTTETKITEMQNRENNSERTEERIEEIRPGYMMHGKVIRPARVKIIK